MVKTLAQLLTERLGTEAYPRVNDVTATVGTTPEKIADPNPNRLALLVVNLSANVIYILHERNVSATRGIRLGPNGGGVSMIYDEEFDIIGWDWWGVATGAASPILVLELIAR